MLARALERFRAIDKLYYRAEKAVVVASFLVMSLVVFLDVVHRTANSDSGLTERTLGRLAPESASRGWLAALVLGLVFFGIFYVAARTAQREPPLSKGTSALVAGGLVVGLYAAVRAFLWILPSGLIWAQTLALVLTLWVGFLGASMATHDLKHLKVDAAEKLVPPAAKRYVESFAQTLTALGCLALSVLGVIFCADWYGQWHDGGGTFGGFQLPKWIAFAVLPLSFGSMGLRFLAQAVARLAGIPWSHPSSGGLA